MRKKKLPIVEVQKMTEQHHAFPGPSPHQQKTWFSWCLLRFVAFLKLFHHMHGYQMVDVTPAREFIHLHHKNDTSSKYAGI